MTETTKAGWRVEFEQKFIEKTEDGGYTGEWIDPYTVIPFIETQFEKIIEDAYPKSEYGGTVDILDSDACKQNLRERWLK